MKLILTEEIYKLGSIGDVVTVKNGYGRNFLLPQGKAIPASKANQKELEHHQRILTKKREKLKIYHDDYAKKLKELEIIVVKKTAQKHKIFGTVTATEISQKFVELGYDIDKKTIKILSSVKSLGTYQAAIRLSSDFSVQIDFTVVADESALTDDEDMLSQWKADKQTQVMDEELDLDKIENPLADS